MTITICPKSAISGLLLGILFTAAAWYGETLAGRAQITKEILAQAKCDPDGWVAITFIDGSQFTCMPAKEMPPTSREEAAQRAQRRKG